MAYLEVNLHHKQITIRSQVFCGTFQDVGNNRKAVFVFLRALRSPETGNPCLPMRRLRGIWVCGSSQYPELCGGICAVWRGFQAFLSRTNLKRERLFLGLQSRCCTVRCCLPMSSIAPFVKRI